MDKFLDLLERVERVDDQNLFDQIFRFFKSINEMDRSTVIAAYQAFKEACKRKGEGVHEKKYDAIRRALIGRMVAIYADAPEDAKPGIHRLFRVSADVPGFWFNI